MCVTRLRRKPTPFHPKIHVEVERARLTKKLADIREADGDIAAAAEIMQDLQVCR